MTKEQAKKIILISENDIDSGAIEIDSSIVYDEGWEHVGDDFYVCDKGIAGPSGGNSTRTFQSTIDIICPCCNRPIGQCHCTLDDIKKNYGL